MFLCDIAMIGNLLSIFNTIFTYMNLWSIFHALIYPLVPGRCQEVDPRARRASTGTGSKCATRRRLGGDGGGTPVVHPAAVG